jgi:glycosyltransferase involved in cell wall biosynthesis
LQEDVEYLNALRPSPKFLRQLIAISQPIADLLKAQPNLQEIPCTMLLDAYLPQSANSHEACANDSVPIQWDFVCVGRFCESKGQEIFLRALHLLMLDGNAPKVAFVGAINDCGQALRDITDHLGLEKSVKFLGHHDGVHEINKQSRWLVCPSLYEPLGRVIFEAWDAGIPVLAGAFAGGAATSIQSSGGGLLFDEWNPTSLATTLTNALATDQAARQWMADQGRTWMLEATHPTRYAAAISMILQDAIHFYQKLL